MLDDRTSPTRPTAPPPWGGFEAQPTLRGSLLSLRPLVSADSAALYAVVRDPLIWEQHPAKERATPAGFRLFFDEALAGGGALLVHDVATNRVIGTSRYARFDAEASEVEIGWTVLARDCWGGRYNAELKQLMLAHAFRFVEHVVFRVAPENIRSQRAMLKIGGVPSAPRYDAAGRESLVFRVDRRAFASPA